MGLSLQEVEVQAEAPVQAKTMTEQERAEAIKRQVEYYFSRHNLLQDTFLLGKMDKDHFVDVGVIAEFKMMKQLTSDAALILECAKKSDKVVVDESSKRIKPGPNSERTTLILRNIPSSANEVAVKELLNSVNVPTILSIRADVGDNWFLSFESQEATKLALERVKSLKWEDKQIGCAIKSDSFLKGLALLPASAVQYQGGYSSFVNGDGQSNFRSNGMRRPAPGGRRNTPPSGVNVEGTDANSKKAAGGKKGKGRNGPREGGSKDSPPRSASPQSKQVQAPLKPSDFPVLGACAVENSGADANSGASTPPLCNTPPLTSEPSPTAAESLATKAKLSYAQMALASVAPSSPAKVQASN